LPKPAFPLSVVLFLLLTVSVLAQVRTFRTTPQDDQNVVQFVSEATLERIVGRTHDIQGSVDLNMADVAATTKGTFAVDLRTIDTGINLRNQHMRENHLETDKYPEATFTLHRILSANRTELLPGEAVSVVAEGDFNIHGVAKVYQIPLTLTYIPASSSPEPGQRLHGGTGDLVNVTAEWSVKLVDHAINRPEFLFMRLAEEQKVSVTFALTDLPPTRKE
jgi:polyisoprenoid-binding protein YceI